MAGQIIPRGKGVWLIRVYLGTDPDTGRRAYYSKTVHGGKKDAEGELAKLLLERDTGRLKAGGEKLTMGALLDDLLLDYKINGKRHDWASIVVETHLRPAFGTLPISRMTTAGARQYIASRQQGGAANATINRELALLRRALNLGAKSDPPKVARVPFIPSLKENNVRKGFFEDNEYLSIFRGLNEELRPVLAFGYHTGCRRGEILSLQWSQVDLTENTIRLEPGTTKNKRARIIPLTRELRELLVMQKARRDQHWPDCPWVFFRYADGRQIRNFYDAWARACWKAGLWEGDEKTGRPTRLFHDLRRSGVRNVVRSGTPEAVAMQISGHKTRAVFDRYNIVSESDLKEAARRLSDYLDRKRAETAIPHTIRTQRQNARTN